MNKKQKLARKKHRRNQTRLKSLKQESLKLKRKKTEDAAE